ncbi:MAG: hypothetical protein ACRELB_18125, partial [Polyangiaceae bacterium]
MPDLLDACARDLLVGATAFTRRNLLHAARRASSGKLDDDAFDLALRERLRRGPLRGLLPPRCRWRARPLPPEWDAYFPRVILLVDRPAIVDLFVASGALAPARMAAVCIDGSPGHVVAWLRRGVRA